MAKAGRPTKEQSEIKKAEKQISAVTKRLIERIDGDEPGMLTLREMTFARLIAEEGYNQTEAYTEVFQPSAEAKEQSIRQLGSRVAARPRVKAEIERIRQDLLDKDHNRTQRLGFALNGALVLERMAIDLAAIAMGPAADEVRMKAWKILGEMRHVQAFVVPAGDQSRDGAFGIKGDATADEARNQLMNSLRKVFENRNSQGVVMPTLTIEAEKAEEDAV